MLFDVGLPFACAWKRLSEFLKRFPYFNRKDDVNVRLILTNYPCPDGTSKTRKQLLNDISKKRSDVNVVVINVRGTFARARACNELHKRARPDSVLLVVDVDMEVQYPFFVHAEMYARAGISVYFPIVWSRFSPASIRLVEKFRGARVGRLSDYEGMWRPYGYGNYAIHGSDALLLQMDENIVGWGGEDNDFHKRCRSCVFDRRGENGFSKSRNGKNIRRVFRNTLKVRHKTGITHSLTSYPYNFIFHSLVQFRNW